MCRDLPVVSPIDTQPLSEGLCLGNAYAVRCRLVASTYTAGEAARALGISLDTLRRWDRQGRIRVRRDSANRRVVSAREVERLRGEDRKTLSARNRLEGVVREVKIEGLLAEVELDVTKGGRLVAVITRESAESLGLTAGMSAAAVVKATSVMVER
jgi:molybdopterin-binding protein